MPPAGGSDRLVQRVGEAGGLSNGIFVFNLATGKRHKKFKERIKNTKCLLKFLLFL
jgi:hypothetical protein